MALQLSDLLIASRAGKPYRLTGTDLMDLIRTELGTNDHEVVTIAQRDALSPSLGDVVYVKDAYLADSTVNAGWAIYRFLGTNAYVKVGEQESLDIVITTTNLSTTTTGTSVTVVNSDGSNAVLPVATSSSAGVMSAVQVTVLNHLTATGAIDLDQLNTDSHVPVVTAGSAVDNPIHVDPTTQSLSFDIASLDPLP